MRTAVIGGALVVLGVIAVATGLLPLPHAVALGQRTWPILLFVVAITVVAELAADAGVFAAVAELTAKWGARRAWLLWIFVVALAFFSTVFLSLDTTAVLLTPVIVLLARHCGLPPLPFALTTVWLANTGSLLLPVSNLTNLLAQHALGEDDPVQFAGLMALPALVGLVIPCVIIAIVFRRDLALRYEPAERTRPNDRPLFTIAWIVVVALLPALVSGIAVWIPACVAASVLLVAFAVRRPTALRVGLVPWQLVILASGLFLVIEAAHGMGLNQVLSAVAGSGSSLPSMLRLSATAGLSANAIDNLPAYLALEPVAGSPLRIAALLIGVNAGALITPWASLATLLWHSRLQSLDVHIPWRRYILLGLVAAPLTVVCATSVLAFAH